jgi:TatD DNase family protein
MDMRYFDAHTHVQFAAFDEDREAAFARAREAGVGMNLVGTQKDTSQAAIDCAKSHDGVWATIGLHPVHTSQSHHDEKELGAGGKAFTSHGEEFDFAAYERMAREEKVVAIGECGLDYYRLDEESKKRQAEAFVAQIELANTVKKPLMLHIRSGARGEAGNGAYEDALALLKTHAKVGGDVHFFAGSWETAQKFLEAGFTLSFTGVVTFATDYEEVVRHTPLDMILSETDAPYVTPAPHRGTRNEPIYIPDIVRKIAAIKELDEEETRHALLANAVRTFGISNP